MQHLNLYLIYSHFHPLKAFQISGAFYIQKTGNTLSFPVLIKPIAEFITCFIDNKSTAEVQSCEYHPIVVSDHAPLLLKLNIFDAITPRQTWRY